MFFKIHFLISRLDSLSEQLGLVSDEHGECFRQESLVMKSQYQSRLSTVIFTDYSWTLQRNISYAQHKSKSTAREFRPNTVWIKEEF